MNDAPAKMTAAIEPVRIGGASTRVSSAIVVLLCVIPALATVLFGGVDSITWVFITLLCATIVVLWAVETWRAGALLINTSPLVIPLIGTIVLGLTQLLASTTLHPYGTRIFVARVGLFTIFLAACLTFVNTETRMRRIVVFTVIFSSLISFVGILQRLADPEAIYGIRSGFQAIPFGPFVNQHHFGTFMEMAGGLCIGLLLGSLPRDKKVLVGLAFAIMLIALILTGSRGGMLSFIVVLGAAVVVRALYRVKDTSARNSEDRLPRKLVIGLGTAAVVVGVIGSIIFIGGDQSLIRGVGLAGGASDTSSGRLHFWSIALQIFTNHPIIGAGLDAYGMAFPRYDTWNGLFRVDHAHNDYLQMLADGGIAGGLIVVAFLVLFVRGSLAVIRSAKAGLRRDVAIGALAGCCGLLVHSIFDFPLRTWSNSFFFLLLVTLATVTIRTEDGDKPDRRKRPPSSRARGSLSSRTATRT